MSPELLRQLGSFWPDAAERLRDVVPDGLALLRVHDHWLELPSQFDRRVRTADLWAPDDRSSLEDLAEDAGLAAQGDGWRLESDEAGLLLERGDELLRIAVAELTQAGLRREVLRVALEQPWRSDVQVPVDGSELLTDVCGRVLGVTDFPIEQEKDVVLDGSALGRAAWMRERVRFRTAESLRARVIASGYRPVPGDATRWWSEDEVGGARLRAEIHLLDGAVELALEKTARESARA
jgi:hypothetical protein